MGPLVPPDLDAEAPVAGVEGPEPGQHPGQARELHGDRPVPGRRPDQGGTGPLPGQGHQVVADALASVPAPRP